MFVILQVTDTIMFKTNLFLYCWCVSVLNSDIFVLLYEHIKACEVLVRACFWLKDKVSIRLVSEI